MFPFGAKNLQEFVERWNKNLPIDRWYRQKYHIAFGSEIHKNVNLADMFFEFYEFVFYKHKSEKKDNNEESYVKGKGNFMKSINYTSKDIDDLFDELDIDNIK